MRTFIAGVATIALAATIAHGQPGKSEDKGGGNGRPAAERGNDHAGHGRSDADRPGQGAQPAAKRDDSGAPRPDAVAERGNGGGGERREERSNRDRNDEERAARTATRAPAPARATEERIRSGWPKRSEQAAHASVAGRVIERVEYARFGRNGQSLVPGCPPGLARRGNGCMPPGLARQAQRDYRPAYFGYTGLDEGRYYYGSGYLYRLGANDRVSGFIPLLGGALGVGESWPSFYEPVQLPPYYVEYFNLGDAPGYRYADDVIYRVDPDTSTITSIAALLTGDTKA